MEIGRFAALSDVHGNLPALEAVIADMKRQGIEHVVNLGDTISGPLWPIETGERLMALGWPTIAGNHDRQLLDRPIGAMGRNDAFAARRLTPALRAWLESLPETLIYADDVFLCHGRPGDDTGRWLHAGRRGDVREATLAEIEVDAVSWPLALCGHTHFPRLVELPGGRIIANPGSIGFPAYQDDLPSCQQAPSHKPMARYLIATRHGAGWSVSLRAVDYDVELSARRAEESGADQWARALRTGHMPAKRTKKARR